MLTVSKSIYVGLGWAGVCAVNHATALYEESFGAGKVPPQIAFLYSETSEDRSMESLMLAFRTTMKNVSSLVPAVSEYEVTALPWIDVYIAGHLSEEGGGAWMLKVAEKIREMYCDHVRIYGYGMLTSDNMDQQQEAYRSVVLLDEDNSGFNSKYDAFYVLEDKTHSAYPILDPGMVCRSLGIGMFLQGSLMSNNIVPDMENSSWKNGMFDVDNKRGWVHTSGACQLVYCGEKMVELHVLKVCETFMEMLLNKAVAGSNPKKVPLTMDIGAILGSVNGLSEARALRLAADKPQKVHAEVSAYLNSWESLLNKVSICATNARWNLNLSLALDEVMSSEGGLPKAEIFLNEVLKLCANIKSDLANEVEKITSQVNVSKEILNKHLADYEAAASKFFRRKSQMEEILNDVSASASYLLSLKTSVELCREVAGILDDFVSCVNGNISVVRNMSEALNVKINDCRERILHIKTDASNSSINEFDISMYDKFGQTYLSAESDFRQYMDSEEMLIASMTADDLFASMRRYAETLPLCNAFKNRLITNVIDEMDETSYQKMKLELNQRVRPLLRLTNRGLIDLNGRPIVDQACSFLYVSMYAEGDMACRLMNDLEVWACKTQNWFRTDVESMKQKMMFYRMDVAYIPYCLEAIKDVVPSEADTLKPSIYPNEIN